MQKTIRASDILSTQKKKSGGTNTGLLLDRLRKIEARTQERENKKRQAWTETQELVQSLEQAGLKHRIAKAGGYKDGFFKFLFSNPQKSQMFYEKGQTVIQKNPGLLEPSLVGKALLPNLLGKWDFGTEQPKAPDPIQTDIIEEQIL